MKLFCMGKFCGLNKKHGSFLQKKTFNIIVITKKVSKKEGKIQKMILGPTYSPKKKRARRVCQSGQRNATRRPRKFL